MFSVGEARRAAPGYDVKRHELFSGADAHARVQREAITFGVLAALMAWIGDDQTKVGTVGAMGAMGCAPFEA